MRFFWLIMAVIFCPCTGLAGPADTLPFYDQITHFMGPLEYSGVEVMVKPQVALSINFSNSTWSLHNVHEYDSQGGIILEQGHFGLCAELATFLFEKIRPLLDARYELKFAKVTESGFFSAPESNHIALLLVDKQDKQFYLIDPSFHKYARVRDLAGYRVLDVQDSLSFVQDKSHDVSFGVNQAMPLYIRNDYLLSFAVTSVDGKFDRNNFVLVVSANRRYKYAGHDIIVIGWRNGEFKDYGDSALLRQILNAVEMNTLFAKLKTWIETIRV